MRQNAGDELTPSQSAVIAAIARSGSLTPSAIAEHERVSRPTVTRIVAKLLDRGLLVRQDDGEDRRSYLLEVSKDGAALRDLQRARKSAFIKRLLASASEDEVKLLAAAAGVLLRLVDEAEG